MRSDVADTSGHHLQEAAQRLYDAEVTLHIAHQTGVDHWINAAADRLHDAVEAHMAARTATTTTS